MSEQPSKLRQLLFLSGGAGLGVIVGWTIASSLGIDPSTVYAGPIGAGVGALLGAVISQATRRSDG